MEENLDIKSRLIAIGSVLLFFVLIWLYVKEFPVFTNTLEVKNLVIGSFITGFLVACGVLYRWKTHFLPAGKHVPEILTILFLTTLFAPLLGSLLNRSLGHADFKSFDFLAETAFVPTKYALMDQKKMKQDGYELLVRDGYKAYKFRYKKQAYYPLTRPGEKILLPVNKGLFGFYIVDLK